MLSNGFHKCSLKVTSRAKNYKINDSCSVASHLYDQLHNPNGTDKTHLIMKKQKWFSPENIFNSSKAFLSCQNFFSALFVAGKTSKASKFLSLLIKVAKSCPTEFFLVAESCFVSNKF